MKKKPIIGIVSAKHLLTGFIPVYKSAAHYVEQVEAAGGIPVQIPLISDGDAENIDSYIDMCDGFILPGGGDFNPSWYGEEMLPNLKPDPDDFDMKTQELALEMVRKMVNSNKPVLGVCLGMQLLNVAFGGSLYQDIPSQVETKINHSTNAKELSDRWSLVHSAKLDESSALRKIIGEKEIMVNSFHHQAVKQAAEEFRITAFAEDGVVEAIEHKNGKVIGVQWHPENLAHAGIASGKDLFQWLVNEAK